MEIDPLRIAETLVVMGSAGAVIYKLGSAVAQFTAIGEKQALQISNQADAIKEIKNTLSVVSGAVATMAVEKVRIDGLEVRVMEQSRLIEDLRRGEGMILPLDFTKKHIPGRE